MRLFLKYVTADGFGTLNKKIDQLLDMRVTQVAVGSPPAVVEEIVKIYGTDIIPSFAGRC